MMPIKNKIPLILRHLCLWSVILLGFLTITATGGKIEEEDDSSDDPTPVSYRKTMEKIDSDFNGVTDSTTVYSYDAKGNLNTKTHYTGEDVSGEPDGIITYQYDSNGNKTKEMRDTNGDGIIEEVSNYFYENGNLTRIEDDNDNNITTAIDSLTEVIWEEI